MQVFPLKRRTLKEPRRGVAVVEFAFILPLFLALIVAIWDLGQVVRGLQIVSIAAREGGRQAASGTKSLTQIETLVRATLTQNGLPASDATFTYLNATSGKDPLTADQSDELRVTVSIPFSSLRLASPQLQKYRIQANTLTVTTTWGSMRDVPVTVPTSWPSG